MSTAANIYNLTKKTYFYLDHAYWLSCPIQTLLTSNQLFVAVVNDMKECDVRALPWLRSLLSYIEPKCVYIIIHDTDWDFQGVFDDYTEVKGTE